MTAETLTTEPRPVRAISRADLTLAIINGVIGSAVFGMPSRIAAMTGVQSPLAHLIAALCVLTIILCFAEVASRFDESGGPYLYAREAFGRHAGFQAGWLTLWTRLLAVAANLNLFADTFALFVPAVQAGPRRAAVIIGAMVIITIINVVGVKQASWVINIFTVGKLLPLALLVIFGLPLVSQQVIATQAIDVPRWSEAILLLIFAFGGFESPLMSAGEAKEARKDTGFALLVSLAVIALVYISVQYVTIGLVPNVQASKTPIADAFSVIWGPNAARFASIAILVSVWGYLTGNGLQAPRLLYSIAERGELPGILSRVHRKFFTPYIAIVVYSIMAATLAIVGTFEGNAVLSAIVRLIVWVMVCVAVWVFRRTKGPAQFRIPFAVPITVLAVVFCVYMLRSQSFQQARIILGTMVVGHVLMLVSDAVTRRRAK